MTLEKAKKITKLKKVSQLQKQKQVQNVIVNLQAPAKKTRKRTTRPKPVQIPKKSSFEAAPLYMPSFASFNPKQPDNGTILSDILKLIKQTKQQEPNELEKTKPSEKPIISPPAPILPSVFGIPQRRTSLIEEI